MQVATETSFFYRVIFTTMQTQPGGKRPAKVRNIAEYKGDSLEDVEQQANVIAAALADLHLTDVKCAWVRDGALNRTTILVNILSSYEIEYTLVPIQGRI